MKTFLLSLCLILSISMAHAQKVSFHLGVGYATPAATQTFGANYFETYNTDTQDYSSKMESVSGSFGAGLNINGGVGVMFSKNLGINLNIQYLSGKEYELIDRTTYTGQYSGTDESVHRASANAIFLNPALVITTGSSSIAPYARLGIVIGSPKIKREQTDFDNTDGLYTQETEYEDKKGTALGLQGAVGVNFPISNNLDIYAEVNMTSMTYRPKQAELTSLTTNGNAEDIGEMEVREKKIEYKKEIDTDFQPEPDEPDQALSMAHAFSSLSLQVGVRFTLGGRSSD